MTTQPFQSINQSRAPLSELQERLLRLLDTHRVLTTAQLMEITAAPERTTEYRMAALAKRGLGAGYCHHAAGGRIRGIGG
jgi:predicted HTH transcriptional regulator